MNDVIKLLPDSVANQIAAGEVIQRPASVIKELVENAVDAGAKCIKIILRDAGKTLIQVVDDGTGMSDTDARLAFERHATSKIRQAADLFELHTMGFRGEALPSIVAVSQVELTTMRRCDQIGTRLCISASRFESQEPEACAPGTSLMVKNLFFNFPARRKFLKKDSVELSHIMHEFERLTLVNPHLEFLLVHNDVTLHQLMAGSLKQRIASLFGKALDKQLIPVDTETPLVKISGFVGLPANARKRNALQYFFVNGRNMRHPYFHKAVLQCYDELISPDHQPNYFLNFEVDPQTIDVNIHPTKSEIKFENEQPIWQILQAAIRESLGKFNAVPAIDFDKADAPDIPSFNPDATAAHGLNIDPDYNPFAPKAPGKNTSGLPGDGDGIISSSVNFAEIKSPAPAAPEARWEQSRKAATSDWDKLYENFRNAATDDPDDYNPFAPSAPPATSAANATSAIPPVHTETPSALNTSHPGIAGLEQPLSVLPSSFDGGVLQLAGRYLITPASGRLLVVDRHRAHVKVLYERFLAAGSTDSAESQQILFPETVTLAPSQHIILESIKEEAATAGFMLEYKDKNTWEILAVPAALGKLSPKDVLLKMIETVGDGMENGVADTAQAIHRHVALSMARSGAVRPGDYLAPAEAEELLAALFALPDPQYTPDGGRILFEISERFIASQL